jgi:hypothetical protein
MRVFVNLRKWSVNYSEILTRVNELSGENRIHSEHIKNIYELIEELVKPKLQARNPIGYKHPREANSF